MTNVVGTIDYVSSKLGVACIESDKYVVYVNLDMMPTGYAKGKRIEYDISTNSDGKMTASNLKLLPSVLAEWHPIRRN